MSNLLTDHLGESIESDHECDYNCQGLCSNCGNNFCRDDEQAEVVYQGSSFVVHEECPECANE